MDNKTASTPLMEAPTRQQLVSVCYSYRHDFGLLDTAEQEALIFRAGEWWRAIAKEINQPSNHPFIVATTNREPLPINQNGYLTD